MDVQQQIRDIKSHLRLYMNGAVSAAMRQHGLDYKLNMGVDVPRLREVARLYEPEHHLAQALWKEPVRECRILAGMLQPADTFYPDIADIWVGDIRNMELAGLTAMNLFQRLPYAPAKSFQWISEEREFTQVCGFLTIGRLLAQRGTMDERSSNEFLDQATSSYLDGGYNVRTAVATALRRYMHMGQQYAFQVCRRVEEYRDATSQAGRMLYQLVSNEVE